MSNTREIKKLDDLMDGALTERFNSALEAVLENAFDPNTNAKAKRRITMTVDVIPNERRDAAEFVTQVTPKFAPPVPIAQTVLISRNDQGVVTAMEHTNQLPGQIDIEGTENIPNVVSFGKKDEGGTNNG